MNVHPSKAQVKFADEHTLFRYVRDAVSAALGKTRIASEAQHLAAPGTTSRQTAWSVSEPEPLGSSFGTFSMDPSAGSTSLPPLRILGQILTTYIVAEGPDGMYVIDQHAAHERVVYDRLLGQHGAHSAEVQGLLEPLTIELSPAEDAALSGLMDELATLGFALEPFGARTHLLRSIPASLAGSDVAATLRGILQDMSQGGQGETFERLAESIACHASVRAGQQLTPEEMRQLVRQLEECAQPRTCPHGRPTIIHFSVPQLEKLFGRRT